MSVNLLFVDTQNSDNLKFIDSNKPEIESGLNSAASEYSGLGKALNASEFGTGNFQSNNLNLTNNDKASIVLPNSWNADEISGNIFNILDYDGNFLNDTFDSGYDSNHWTSDTNDPSHVTFDWYNASSGTNDSIYMRFDGDGSSIMNTYYDWDYSLAIPRDQIPFAYWEISFRYRMLYDDYSWTKSTGGAYHSVFIDVNGNSQEFSLPKLDTLDKNVWYTESFVFQPEIYSFELPGTLSLIFERAIGAQPISPTGYLELYYDNITLTLSTIPRPHQINLTMIDETHNNTVPISDGVDYGQGSLNSQNTWEGNMSHYFSFSHNSSGNVIISSNLNVQASSSKKTTTQLGVEGSIFKVENNSLTQWSTYFTVNQPGSYSSGYYFNVSKPLNWVITEVIDPYLDNKVAQVLGTGYGNTTFSIPNSIITNGIWKFVAEAPNYVQDAKIYKKNEQDWTLNSTFYPSNKFKINASIDNTLISSPELTNGSLQIFYPNGTLYYEEISSVSSTGDLEFSEITLGAQNTSVGRYFASIRWNDYDTNISQVGYYELEFKVLHHTSLFAVDSYFEQIAGEPLLIKVNFTDIDLNVPIEFGEVIYQSYFGSGVMSYIGSGVYFSEIDTSGSPNGDYYFSINASKSFYKNQTTTDLIHLKLNSEPIKLVFTSRVINSTGNSYAMCRVDLEGEISGAPLSPANFSTDWDNGYSYMDYGNGTYDLNFSTNGLPLEGVIETYEIGIFVNKINYESISDSITLIVHPIATSAEANRTNIVSYINENFDIKVNYTIASNNALISGAECTVQWDSDYEIDNVTDGFVIKYYTTNLNIDAYNSLITLSKPGYEDALVNIVVIVNEQDVSIYLSINGDNVTQNEPIELSFEETINVTARVYADREHAFLTGGVLTMMSDHYEANLTEPQSTYYNLVEVIDGEYFDTGLSTIYLRFEKNNYTTTVFSFQFFIRAQNVNLTVRIDNELIPENHLIEKFNHQNITVSCRAFAEIEAIYLSGGSVVLITELNEISLSEDLDFWYNKTFTISSDLLSQGINYVYLKFDLSNYTTTTFSFQIYLRAQPISLDVRIDHQNFTENHLLTRDFNQNVSISCRAFADVEKIYLTGGTITLFIDTTEISLSENANYWYNGSFIISTDLFSLGFNNIYLRFEHENYTTTIFSIQLQVNQISINIRQIGFTNSLDMYSGDKKLISINLTELNSNKPIENATVTCNWRFGQYSFEYTGNGIYNLTLGPFTAIGTYPFNIIITPKENEYKVSQFSFDIIISEKPVPNYLFLIIIISLIAVVGILGVLSLRSYVILPRKRRKQQLIAEKTQGYKDIRNIEAIIISSKQSGMTLYNKTFSILDEDYITGFSGFIQAITILGKQYTKAGEKVESEDELMKTTNEIKELDFNFFHSLICDHEQIRLILLLREKSSEQLRQEIEHLARDLYKECEDLIVGFLGNLKAVRAPFEEVIDRHLAFYYKGPFTLNKNEKYQLLKLSGDLSNLELRVLNVLESQSKYNKQFLLNVLFTSLLQNVDQDSLIIAIESLIAHELIIPQSQKYSLYLN